MTTRHLSVIGGHRDEAAGGQNASLARRRDDHREIGSGRKCRDHVFRVNLLEHDPGAEGFQNSYRPVCDGSDESAVLGKIRQARVTLCMGRFVENRARRALGHVKDFHESGLADDGQAGVVGAEARSRYARLRNRQQLSRIRHVEERDL